MLTGQGARRARACGQRAQPSAPFHYPPRPLPLLLPCPACQDDIAAGRLSNAQLETVLYAFQRFARLLPDGSRAGFFLGDGAGVGKGRQIAAVIKEFWCAG
jgi:hypothetical protein